MIAAWLLALRLHGVVDQVDAGWAYVEWESREFGYVPAALLPADVEEGDAIVLRVHRRHASGFVEVPRHGVVRASVHKVRPRRAARGRGHERRDS